MFSTAHFNSSCHKFLHKWERQVVSYSFAFRTCRSKESRRLISTTTHRWSKTPSNFIDYPSLLPQAQSAQATRRAAEVRLAAIGLREGNKEQFKVTEVAYQQGNISSINLSPDEILKRTCILPRDLVSLNLTSREEQSNRNKRRLARPPTAILPRTDCILLSFGNVRAVAGRDSVYILDAHSMIADSFAKDLSAVFLTDKSGDSPELIFLEAVLRDTVDTFARRLRIFEPIVDDFLTRASNDVFSDAGVHQLLPLKDSLQNFELQVKQSLECLTSLLNDDQLMLQLLLTEQAEAHSRGEEVDFQRHEHVELMLSVYSRQIQNQQQEIQYMLGRLQSKQEFVGLALAGYRNRLVRMNVNLGIWGVSTGLTTAVTGLFGMNLISGYEESPIAFAIVAGCSSATAVLVAGTYFSFIRNRMMQERAEQRLAEIDTYVNALSEMSALDYTVKRLMSGSGRMDKDTFKKQLIQSRTSQRASDEEIDLLFHVLDTNKDNELSWRDFSNY